MICAKCGTEYEGSQCPKCDGPVIKINNSDYLARRKAYEEKQAKLKRKEVPGKDRIDKTEKKDKKENISVSEFSHCDSMCRRNIPIEHLLA